MRKERKLTNNLGFKNNLNKTFAVNPRSTGSVHSSPPSPNSSSSSPPADPALPPAELARLDFLLADVEVEAERGRFWIEAEVGAGRNSSFCVGRAIGFVVVVVLLEGEGTGTVPRGVKKSIRKGSFFSRVFGVDSSAQSEVRTGQKNESEKARLSSQQQLVASSNAPAPPNSSHPTPQSPANPSPSLAHSLHADP